MTYSVGTGKQNSPSLGQKFAAKASYFFESVSGGAGEVVLSTLNSKVAKGIALVGGGSIVWSVASGSSTPVKAAAVGILSAGAGMFGSWLATAGTVTLIQHAIPNSPQARPTPLKLKEMTLGEKVSYIGGSAIGTIIVTGATAWAGIHAASSVIPHDTANIIKAAPAVESKGSGVSTDKDGIFRYKLPDGGSPSVPAYTI